MIAVKVLKTLSVFLTLSDNCPELSIYFCTGLVTVRVFRYATHSCGRLITALGGGSLRLNLLSEQEKRWEQRKRKRERENAHICWHENCGTLNSFFSRCGVLLPRVRVQHLGLLFYETFPTDLSVLFVNSRTFSARIHKTWKRGRCMWSLSPPDAAASVRYPSKINICWWLRPTLFILLGLGSGLWSADVRLWFAFLFSSFYQQMCRC